jgi:protein-S-isoprenylcysteine O-methyltransferase Ste14
MALVVFLAAGTVRYWRGWAFLVVSLGASAAVTADLIARDSGLLERRLSGGPFAEREPTQRRIMGVVSILYVALIVVPAFAFARDLATIPAAVSIVGLVLIAAGFLAIVFVFRENPFAASTIQIAAGERVVSTGPYAIVRHPMYAGALLYLIGTPLALGSWWGFAPLVAMIPFLIWRLLDEERFLTQNLAGYGEYIGMVRWRLVPGLF